MVSMAVVRFSSDGNALRNVLPVLWMTSRFHRMVEIARIKDDAYISSSSPSGVTEGEACRL